MTETLAEELARYDREHMADERERRDLEVRAQEIEARLALYPPAQRRVHAELQRP